MLVNLYFEKAGFPLSLAALRRQLWQNPHFLPEKGGFFIKMTLDETSQMA